MTIPPSTKLNCARTDCEHGLVPASVTRRSQDWTGHRLGGIKPGGPVNPHQEDYAFAARFTTASAGSNARLELCPLMAGFETFGVVTSCRLWLISAANFTSVLRMCSFRQCSSIPRSEEHHGGH